MRKFKIGLLVAVVLLGGCNGMENQDATNENVENTAINKDYRVVDTNRLVTNKMDTLEYFYIKGRQLHQCVAVEGTEFVMNNNENFNKVPKNKKIYPLTVTPNAKGYCTRVVYKYWE